MINVFATMLFPGQCCVCWAPTYGHTRRQLQVLASFTWSSANTCLPETGHSSQQGHLKPINMSVCTECAYNAVFDRDNAPPPS